MKKTITFDDVLLTPQYSEIVSRKSIDISSSLSENIVLDLPIIAAPMDTVTNSYLISKMNKHGATGILHRYNSTFEQVAMLKRVKGLKAAAVGVTGDYADRALKLVNAGATVICVDVAQAHHALVKHALKVLRNTIGYDVHIMAGNVATLEAFNDFADWGADSIKVGIGGGSICSTRIQTGHGVPTLQSVMDCAQSDRECKTYSGWRNQKLRRYDKGFGCWCRFCYGGFPVGWNDRGSGESPSLLPARIIKISWHGLC